MKKVLLLGLVLSISVFFSGCFAKPKITKEGAKEIFASFFPKEVAEVEVVGENLKIILKNKVIFDKGKSQLKEEAKESLNKVIDVYVSKILPAYLNSSIVIEGYADSDGSEKYNLNLSEKRAESVVSYLSTKSLGIYIDTSKLSAKGYGEKNPRVENSSKANKAINRRVELVFKGIKN